MKEYIGIKEISAQPMTSDEAIKQGYKVGNHNQEDGYEVQYKDGYKSWSPKKVFDESYIPIEKYNGQSGLFKVDGYKKMFAVVGGGEENISKLIIGTLNVTVNGKEEAGLNFIQSKGGSSVGDVVDDFYGMIDDNKPSFIYIPHSEKSIDSMIEYLNDLKKQFKK